MTNDLINPSKALGYSDIYLDYLAGKDAARKFYYAADLDEVIPKLDAINYDRDKMAAILERQNRAFGATQETLDNINRLKDPKSLCVFSGQQAGVLTGPMLVITKAIGIIKAAQCYADHLKRPVIPIFWIAGDDHDFEEANHTWLMNRNGEPQQVTYQTPPETAVPTYQIKFSDSDELSRMKNEIKDLLGETDFTGELYELIDKSYTPEDTMVSAFGKFMSGLMGRFGLVLFNPGDNEAKAQAVPLFKAIVEQQNGLHEISLKTNNRIAADGYHIQVEKKDDATHLFYNTNERIPISKAGEKFVAGDHSFTRAELLEEIEKYPEHFSPDVMTRPLLQSYLFPVISQKGGPSEIAYLAQINPLFELFGLTPPFHKARPTVTIIEKRFDKQMAELEIAFEDLTGDIEQVINRVLARTFPADLEESSENLRRNVEDLFESFRSKALHFDPSLKGFADKTFGKIDFSLKAFEEKVFAAHKRKSNETREKIYRLHNALFPHRSLQERSINIVYFLSKYGTVTIDHLYNAIECEQTDHQLIHLAEMGD